MHRRTVFAIALAATLPLCAPIAARAQDPPPFFGPGQGRRPFGGPGMRPERKLVRQFDTDGDKRLSNQERAAAREFLKNERANAGPGRGFGPPFGGPGGFGRGRNAEPAKPGPRVSPDDVENYPSAELYDPNVLRTIFLDFENDDWEAELQDFHGTDVEVPATLTVDGKKYGGVGVHFRGMSSYMMVPAGYKRSLNVSVDFVDEKQRVKGYKTLNLLNNHGDGTLMSAALYSHLARKRLPAPRANLVRVVINGESWGIYTNVQQFDKIFVQENFKSDKGARWKVKGSPGGDAGLNDVGDNRADYARRYDLKSPEDSAAWNALIRLCKTLSHTPLDELEAALEPQLDIDGALWFLALDIGLLNSDGYWIRASDYSLYRDEKGKFHLIPHDMNEAFRPGGGPGFGPPPGGFGPPPEGFGPPPEGFGPPPGEGPPGFGGPGRRRMPGAGLETDPLVGADDLRKPLRSRLLAVPKLRERYLEYVRTLARDGLDWQKLGPVVAKWRAMIEKDVAAETRRADSNHAEFLRLTADTVSAPPTEGAPRRRGPMGGIPLREFAEKRRQYLLSDKPGKKQP